MAEAFLSQLLQVENSVQPASGENCIICHTECGTLCPETGIVEMEIRLPCTHIIGSRCIATWLSPTGAANNTCPVCRYIFFPAQPLPYLEHGTIGVNRNSIDNGEFDVPGWFDYLVEIINDWNTGLDRPENVGENVAEPDTNSNFDGPVHGGAENGDEEAAEEGNSEDIIPEPPVQETVLHDSAPLQRIAPDFLVSEPLVPANVPRHSARQQGIEEDDEQDIREEPIEEDEEEIVLGGIDQHNTANLETVKIMCLIYCRRLNLTSTRVTDVSKRFAENIFIACRTVGHTPPSIAAVSVLVASHLTGAPKTLHWVSMMSGVDADVISGLYFFIYTARVRVELIDAEMLAMIDRGDVDTVLGFLPPA